MESQDKQQSAKEDSSNGVVRERWGKRAFDFMLGLTGLMLSLPLWVIIPFAIYLDDSGPVFFKQKRVGKGGKSFNVIKFRTMKVGAEKLGVIDLENDPRVTNTGRVLRATALDELPELINILRGDMSFVGPRPLPFAIDGPQKKRYPTLAHVPGYDLRIRVRPGLTGIAVVYASKDISHRQRFRYDALYIYNMSFWFDMKLILLSFWVSFRGAWEQRGRKVRK
jgi:lipopolysaccharide/colanic/teichoic acid biosynthesis glycosyltransferase